MSEPMTPELRTKLLFHAAAKLWKGEPVACFCPELEMVADAIREAEQAAAAREREACIAVIRQYLLFDSQRAVSWHEVQDCIAAIRARGKP